MRRQNRSGTPFAFESKNKGHILFCRSALGASTLQYLSSHFNDGTASVFATPDYETCFVIQIVANKYNPANFWSDRATQSTFRRREFDALKKCRKDAPIRRARDLPQLGGKRGRGVPSNPQARRYPWQRNQ
ncbi:hypothetical protein BC826DRAFT_1041338 [Russula brevipes]|nr:hypothetical protein BC826DRAFT_1041338 [Russula brevipes]